MNTASTKTEIKRLLLKTDTLAVELLPELGGKIASLRRNGIELMQQPLRPYALRNLEMSFEESDASGFDECLPSVAACDVKTPAGIAHIPDHGEFWRLPCTVEQSGTTTAHLIATGFVLPLRFERTFAVDGDSLRIDYRVENVGDFELGYAWSAHPLFAIDAGDRIALSASVQKVHVEGSGHKRLGSSGAVHSWPVTELAGGIAERLDLTRNVSDNTGDKLFASAPAEGWAALERKRAGLRVTVHFDPSTSPWLGLWLCYGGWPEGQSERQFCVALEPCTAPADSLAVAIEKGFARMLAPGQSAQWWIRIEVNPVS